MTGFKTTQLRSGNSYVLPCSITRGITLSLSRRNFVGQFSRQWGRRKTTTDASMEILYRRDISKATIFDMCAPLKAFFGETRLGRIVLGGYLSCHPCGIRSIRYSGSGFSSSTFCICAIRGTGVGGLTLNPFRTGIPFWGQTSQLFK